MELLGEGLLQLFVIGGLRNFQTLRKRLSVPAATANKYVRTYIRTKDVWIKHDDENMSKLRTYGN